ncbi:hypothetical protein Dda_7471 [Drechslerella dactyloides]|uniref:Uncharacterized protein n=1 Tax=Drechslerella dactyloides TaxID=74499 RepID=A0AAD6ISE9_DREDA|nr:hypothetical protein Dda_7471 [Drechslerella dactyloides]
MAAPTPEEKPAVQRRQGQCGQGGGICCDGQCYDVICDPDATDYWTQCRAGVTLYTYCDEDSSLLCSN